MLYEYKFSSLRPFNNKAPILPSNLVILKLKKEQEVDNLIKTGVNDRSNELKN